MSRQAGIDALHGVRSAGRIPVMEHLGGLSREAIKHFSGIDPVAEPRRVNEAFRRLTEVFENDLVWGGGLPDDPERVLDWSTGPRVRQNSAGLDVVQWGIFGTVHQEDGRHFTHIPKPVSVDDALSIRPLDLFPDTVEQYRERFNAKYQRMLASTGETCLPIPHHYTTLFHWALAIFGFELLCEVGMAGDRFGSLMAQFAQVSRRITTAWAGVPGLHAFICHDDLTMTSGPIFSPDWYRQHIFPHYPSIFAPLKEAGVPVIFTSDGDCSAFVDDVFAAGADGLNFEHLVDMDWIVARHPDKTLIGNLDSATIAGGSPERIEDQARRCIQAAAKAPRFVINVGGQLTHDIPVAHLEHYLDIRKQLSREYADATALTPWHDTTRQGPS